MMQFELPQAPRRFRHFIDDRFVDGHGDGLITRRSPGHGMPVAQWPAGTARDADEAIAAARRAFDAGPWPRMPAGERAKLLFAVADAIERDAEEIALIECLETGKPITQAIGEVKGAADVWRFAAGAARLLVGEAHNQLGERLLALVLREPVGVVGVVTPWNFPFFILAERLPFILAAGCTAVVKPAEATSGSTLKLAELLQQAGLPAGVVNVVTGAGAVVGQRLLDSERVDMVSVTGSTTTGRRAIAASAANIKKLGLELGGKNPHLVFADADLDAAADGVAFGMAFNAGQCCVGGSRLVVERSIADEFVERLASKLKRIRVGDPLDPATQVGALFDEAHLAKVLAYIEGGVAEGARLVCGGSRTGDRRGFFVAPTLLDQVRPSTPLVREEIFGPVLAVLPCDGLDDALRIANDTEFGLSASIWTLDLSLAMRALRGVRAGRVWVNTTLDNGPETPLGGMKQSGLGRDAGLAGIEEYTELKTAHLSLLPRARWIANP